MRHYPTPSDQAGSALIPATEQDYDYVDSWFDFE